MGIKGINEEERNEINSVMNYTRSIIVFLLIVVLAAVFFFTVGCQSNKNSARQNGIELSMITSAQSFMDYTAASMTAKTDSLPNIEVLFKAGAVMEQVHLGKLKELLQGYPDADEVNQQLGKLNNVRNFDTGTSVVFLFDTAKHSLAYFIGRQSYMINTLFESLVTQSIHLKEPELAKWYSWFWESEQSAYRLYTDAYKNWSENSLFTDKYNVCPRCGSIYIYGDHVQDCTVCGEKSDTFILVQ